MELNQDYKTRDKILFGEEKDWDTPLRNYLFTGLKSHQLEIMVHKVYIRQEDQPEDMPTLTEMIHWVQINLPNATFHGSAASPKNGQGYTPYSMEIYGVLYKGDWVKKELLEFWNNWNPFCEIHIDEKVLYAELDE